MIYLCKKYIFYNMKKKLIILLLCAITMGTAYAQNQPVDMRVEVTDVEFDDDEFSIFTYKDSEADDSFGYYLSLGRVTKFLGADEILNMEVFNIYEVAIWLGATTDEALATLGSMIDLYDKDVNTAVEFNGRASTSGFKLGETVTTTCVVGKKLLGGKRLEFLFPVGKYQAVCYVPKSVLRDLRNNFKIDIKLHPSQHR